MSPSFGARQDLCRTTKEDGAGELSAPAAGMKMLGSERRRKRRIFLLDGDAMPLVRAEDDMPLVRDFIHSAHDFAAQTLSELLSWTLRVMEYLVP